MNRMVLHGVIILWLSTRFCSVPYGTVAFCVNLWVERKWCVWDIKELRLYLRDRLFSALIYIHPWCGRRNSWQGLTIPSRYSLWKVFHHLHAKQDARIHVNVVSGDGTCHQAAIACKNIASVGFYPDVRFFVFGSDFHPFVFFDELQNNDPIYDQREEKQYNKIYYSESQHYTFSFISHKLLQKLGVIFLIFPCFLPVFQWPRAACSILSGSSPVHSPYSEYSTGGWFSSTELK